MDRKPSKIEYNTWATQGILILIIMDRYDVDI